MSIDSRLRRVEQRAPPPGLQVIREWVRALDSEHLERLVALIEAAETERASWPGVDL